MTEAGDNTAQTGKNISIVIWGAVVFCFALVKVLRPTGALGVRLSRTPVKDPRIIGVALIVNKSE